MYQRANGTWCDTIPQGKGKPHKFFYGKTKAEVKKKISEWKEKQEKGKTVDEAVAEWEETHYKNVRESTVRTYHASVERILEAFKGVYVKDLQAAQIQAFWNQLAAQRFARTTISTTKVVLTMILNHQILSPEGTLKYNPVTATRIPSSAPKHIRELPDRNCIEIIKKSVGVEFGLFPFLLIYTGCRKNEALALTDKDFTKDSISISKSVYWHSDGKPEITVPKTSAAIREVFLLPPLAQVLPKWEGYLFSCDGGKTPLSSQQFFKLWSQYCLAVGLAHREYKPTKAKGRKQVQQLVYHVTPHQLRHEYATICFDAGIEAKDAANLLGHTTDIMTRNIYTHITNTRKQETGKKLSEYVTKIY